MKLSKLIQFCAITAMGLVAMPAEAQQVVGKDRPLPPLHVDGRFFKDEQGNKVVLHGVMDTPSMWFNGYGPWNDHHSYWEGGYNDTGATNCVAYFDKIFTAITDYDKGAYCNIFRLHLDPAWTNGNDGSWNVDDRENVYDPNDPNSKNGENYFARYTSSRLEKYLGKVYIPIAQKAMKHGMYVIMRPPGVCPPNIYVGGSYQKFLLDVWDRVSKNEKIQLYCGQISLELANEPINVKLANGQSSEKALHDFFQPIVDKIRENGFKGIILIPGTGYQSNYRDYVNYPITGENIGYAVHDYAGWYGTSDDSYDTNNAIKQFGNQVPVVKTNPIVITEVDWSPQNKSGEIDHYNEFGQPVYKNYGTWATASTSKWGKAYKAILDHYGNISMTLTSTADYIDINDYLYNNKKVTPAFKTAMKQNQVDPYEACGVACFDWYEQYFQVDYASLTRYQPLQQYPEDPFELSQEWFKPSIIQQGSAQHTASFSILTINKGGLAGWSYEDGIDFSSYKTLVVKLRRTSKNTFLRIYDTGSLFGDYYELDLSGEKEFEIPLHDLKKASGEPLDLSHIRFVGFSPKTANVSISVEKVYLSTEETAIDALEAEVSDEEGYVDLMGRPVENPTSGIYIRRSDNKKVYIK